ncbi:MAG: DUF1192 domain-containing protein [Alphaproteobacteria bacterium]|nr:DUF1192 domain-containing protein [Alphaproteobacteria bacterium]
MVDKDDEPSPLVKPRLDLALLSIEELEARILALEAEARRCREIIASKQGALSSAEAVFRRG